MIVTKVEHNFHDCDIECANIIERPNVGDDERVEIVLKYDCQSVVLFKEELILLAKEFNLLVFEKSSVL